MFTDCVARDAPSSTKRCRRHINYVHPKSVNKAVIRKDVLKIALDI